MISFYLAYFFGTGTPMSVTGGTAGNAEQGAKLTQSRRSRAAVLDALRKGKPSYFDGGYCQM